MNVGWSDEGNALEVQTEDRVVSFRMLFHIKQQEYYQQIIPFYL